MGKILEKLKSFFCSKKNKYDLDIPLEEHTEYDINLKDSKMTIFCNSKQKALLQQYSNAIFTQFQLEGDKEKFNKKILYSEITTGLSNLKQMIILDYCVFDIAFSQMKYHLHLQCLYYKQNSTQPNQIKVFNPLSIYIINNSGKDSTLFFDRTAYDNNIYTYPPYNSEKIKEKIIVKISNNSYKQPLMSQADWKDISDSKEGYEIDSFVKKSREAILTLINKHNMGCLKATNQIESDDEQEHGQQYEHENALDTLGNIDPAAS